MAALIKGRLSDDSDVRLEAFAASFQTRRNARMPKPCKRKTAENFPFWRERGTSLRLVESRIHFVRTKENIQM